jgi:hypothetical protein
MTTKAAVKSVRVDLCTEKIQRWLSPPDPSTNANQARILCLKGLGVWLLKKPIFQLWYSGLCQHLSLYGLAGCGKIILSTTVLDYLLKKKNSLILSFFFDFSDAIKQSCDGML